MARKTYTEEDRARVRQALLDTGLNMAVSKGPVSYTHLTLPTIRLV